MAEHDVWIIVARPLWGGESAVIGTATDDGALSAIADSWRGQETVRSTDSLIVQRWQGCVLMSEKPI